MGFHCKASGNACDAADHFLLVLTIQMHEFEKQVQAWDKEIRQQQEQIEELYDRQDPVEQTDMTDVYGCKSLYGTYDFRGIQCRRTGGAIK